MFLELSPPEQSAQTARGEVDAAARECTVEAGARFEAVALALEPHGLALANTPSLLQTSLVGALLTGTHGCARGPRLKFRIEVAFPALSGGKWSKRGEKILQKRQDAVA